MLRRILFTVLLTATLTASTGATVPTLGNLHGDAGAPGELLLNWTTPLLPIGGDGLYAGDRDVDLAYEMRYSSDYITQTTWNSALGIPNLPILGVQFLGGIQLDLIVGAKQSACETITYGDTLVLRATLDIYALPEPIRAINRSLMNQPIDFEVWKNGNLIDSTDLPVLTRPPFGYATWVTDDLTDSTEGEWVTCKAKWGGGTLWAWDGFVVAPASITVSEDAYVQQTSFVHGTPGDWFAHGGEYDLATGDLTFHVGLPMGALSEDTEVTVSQELSPPPPVGMDPAVPGAMCAWHLDSAGDPWLARPARMQVDYPASLLSEYGGLGELSLRPYFYDEWALSWVPVELDLCQLNLDEHRLGFRFDRFGLYALAAETDGDADHLGDMMELEFGCEPGLADSDGDGFTDGEEIWARRSDPADPASNRAAGQYFLATDLPAEEPYWVAARIVTGRGASELADPVYVGPPLAAGFSPASSVPGVFEADAAWADLDGDADPDLAICGSAAGTAITRIYENQGSGLVLAQELTGIAGAGSGCLAWCDVDGDGDQDLALAGMSAGGRVLRLYLNGGGVLGWDGQSLPGLSGASLAWADLDTDGDPDLLVQGRDELAPVGRLYLNDGAGGLTLQEDLHGLANGSADWGDWDGDGDPDLIRTGGDGAARLTLVYRNDGGALTDLGNLGLPDLALSDTEWADYDADGHLDLAITGQTGAGLNMARVYRGDGAGGFTLVTDQASIYRSSCAWGDIDLDGDQDLAFCGYTGVSLTSLIVENMAGVFSPWAFGLPPVREGALAFVDFDLDGDRDFFLCGADWSTEYAELYRNDGITLTGLPTDPAEPPATALRGVFPNPFNPKTTLVYELAASGRAFLAIYDAAGRRVRQLVEGSRPAGRQEAVWDGRDEAGRPCASGHYFARLVADGAEDRTKLLLLK